MTNREIDAMVAEKLMGWTLSTRDGYGWPIAVANVQPVKVANYSTDIACAWRVVEKMRERCGVQIDTVGFEPNVFRCVMGWGDDTISGNADDPTAPLAICKAALRAVGEVVP